MQAEIREGFNPEKIIGGLLQNNIGNALKCSESTVSYLSGEWEAVLDYIFSLYKTKLDQPYGDTARFLQEESSKKPYVDSGWTLMANAAALLLNDFFRKVYGGAVSRLAGSHAMASGFSGYTAYRDITEAQSHFSDMKGFVLTLPRIKIEFDPAGPEFDPENKEKTESLSAVLSAAGDYMRSCAEMRGILEEINTKLQTAN